MIDRTDLPPAPPCPLQLLHPLYPHQTAPFGSRHIYCHPISPPCPLHSNNKHAYAGATDSFTYLRVLLVLTDRGIFPPSYRYALDVRWTRQDHFPTSNFAIWSLTKMEGPTNKTATFNDFGCAHGMIMGCNASCGEKIFEDSMHLQTLNWARWQWQCRAFTIGLPSINPICSFLYGIS
jgi:hypothetical protein